MKSIHEYIITEFYKLYHIIFSSIALWQVSCILCGIWYRKYIRQYMVMPQVNWLYWLFCFIFSFF